MRKVSLLEMKMGMKAKTFKRNERKFVAKEANARFERRVQAEAKEAPLGVIRS